MAKFCPPGFICIENMTIIFLIIILYEKCIIVKTSFYKIINITPLLSTLLSLFSEIMF